MDLASLRIFKSVVEQGGINKAAAKLHRVPSNVTTRIKQLEEQLGAELFLRVGGRLALSSEGKLLLTYADRLLRLSSEAEAALRQGKPRGTLRIGALESTAGSRLPPVLSRYHALYPEVQIETRHRGLRLRRDRHRRGPARDPAADLRRRQPDDHGPAGEDREVAYATRVAQRAPLAHARSDEEPAGRQRQEGPEISTAGRLRLSWRAITLQALRSWSTLC